MTTPPNFTDGTWTIAGTLHFGGDPNGDILWQNIASQSLILWQQSGATTTSVAALPSLKGFNAFLVGDFDRDGVGDVLIRNASNFQNKLLLSTTGTLQNVFNSQWTPSATTDLTNDGSNEIIWVNPTSTQMNSWVMDSGSPVNQPSFATGYENGDRLLSAFDGTGTQSFRSLWFDVSANNFNIATYAAGVRTINSTFTVDPSVIFENTGDYNGDGRPDFLFLDKVAPGKGNAIVVFTNGTTETGRIEWLSADASNQQVVASGDFDNDGNTELLMRDGVGGDLRLVNAIGGSNSFSTVYGSGADDLIDGQGGADQIFGREGNDILLGGAGTDTLFGGDGRDWIEGGADDDSLWGDAGDDELRGGDGDDVVDGGPGNDVLRTGAGTDLMSGGDGDDFIVSETGVGFDHFRGGAGNDVLITRKNAILEGGDGDDFLMGDNGLDNLFGGNGNDILIGGLSLDTLFGGAGDDILIGVDRPGTSGTSDTLFGGSGADFFYLGSDTDIYYDGGGAAVIKDYSQFQGDRVVLNGSSFLYNFVDTGPHVEIRLASNANLIATLENVATVAEVLDNAIFIN